ncbi:MAG: glycoside hydrolase family 3 [Chlorobiaceae bacterium]|nr:glycoside hydrolase family 3 [Chlorobiaceae bacterium]
MKKILLSVATLFLLSATALPVFAAQKTDSLSVKIGQMLMIGFRGLSVADSPGIAEEIRERKIGGVVLFDYDVPLHSTSRNISSPDQLARLTLELQKLSKIPLLIGIDQEGGKVNRLKAKFGFPPSVSAEHLGVLNNPDSTTAAAATTARTLKSLHIGLNFAPVADLNVNPDNPVIGKLGRSFSGDVDVAVPNIRLTVKAFNREGIIATLKHFPGHGSSTTDTHLDFTDITNSWSEKELEPYRTLIASGYRDVIMTAHVFNGKLDPIYPATLSKSTITDLLRNRLGFKGVVVSDDMQMKAIADRYGLEEAIRLAIDAGVDILLFGNNTAWDPAIGTKATAIIRSLVERKLITDERIDRSYRRVMELKKQYLKPRI